MGDDDLTDELAAARFRAMCEMHDFGVYLTKQRLLAEHPDATPEEMARLMDAAFGHDDHAWESIPGFRVHILRRKTA